MGLWGAGSLGSPRTAKDRGPLPVTLHPASGRPLDREGAGYPFPLVAAPGCSPGPFSLLSLVYLVFCLKFTVHELRPTEPQGHISRVPVTFRGRRDRSLGSLVVLGVLEGGAHGSS